MEREPWKYKILEIKMGFFLPTKAEKDCPRPARIQ
jgi:hypothetical protein